jgi:predicted acyl esterase
LDATPSDWEGDGKRHDFMALSVSVPKNEMAKTYSADVNIGVDPCWSHGVSLVTDPLKEDIVIAGYIKLVMWVSSTSSDMDIHASVRVMDESNKEVPYALSPGIGYYPVGLGWLKVSHRALDPETSTIYRPYHTHKMTDYAPLSSPTEVVEVEVELWPTTALIKKGQRIRLDVQPADGCDHGNKHAYDATYHLGAFNTIYTGPSSRSYLQLPVIPPKHHKHHGHHGHDRD